jgi:hypothetical protein
MPSREQHSGILGLNPTVNQKSNPYIAGSDLWKLQGWYLSEAMSIQKRLGFQKLNLYQSTENSLPMSFTGLFEYLPSAGVNKKIATGTTGVYVYNTPDQFKWNLASIPAARTGTRQNLYASRMLFDQFYLGGGGSTDVNLRYNGTSWFQMGITAPSTTLTAGAPSAGGNMGVGAYSYRVTFVNELNQESNPSAVSNTVTTTAGNNTVALSSIPVSSDPQVTKRNIYRTTAGGGVYLLLTIIPNNSATTFSDTLSDAVLGVALDAFSFGVPSHFSMIELYRGVAFMGGDPNNKSRIWFSYPGQPANVNSNDFRDLDPNDGDILAGMIQYQSTIAAFKGQSIWLLSGSDRTNYAFTKQVTHVGSINNSCLVEIPMVAAEGVSTPAGGKIVLLSPTKRFYFFDGTTATQTAIGLEPILNRLDAAKLSGVSGTIVPSLNQARWVVPSDAILGQTNDLIIWYDYVLDKWGTTELNLPANVSALLHDDMGIYQYYIGGAPSATGPNISGGWVYQGDISGTDDGAPITIEVIDKSHPRYLMNPSGQSVNYPTPENIKVFSQMFIWFKTMPTPGVQLKVYGIIDDPTNVPILIGTINCTNPTGQEHLTMNLQGKRLYIRILETSAIQGVLLRGWKVYFKDVGRI